MAHHLKAVLPAAGAAVVARHGRLLEEHAERRLKTETHRGQVRSGQSDNGRTDQVRAGEVTGHGRRSQTGHSTGVVIGRL